MGKLSFSPLQKKQYQEIKKLFAESGSYINLSDDDNVRLNDVLLILAAKGYICPMNVDGANMYSKEADFQHFEEWHKDQEREEKKLSVREWKIAIVSALIGLIPFIITTVIPWMRDTVFPWVQALLK